MGLSETTAAIQAAAKAFVGWSKTTAKVCSPPIYPVFISNSNVHSNAMIFFSSLMLSCRNTMMTLDALSSVAPPSHIIKRSHSNFYRLLKTVNHLQMERWASSSVPLERLFHKQTRAKMPTVLHFSRYRSYPCLFFAILTTLAVVW